MTFDYIGTKRTSSGPCTVSGDVSFALLEPLSLQKMWTKRTEIEPGELDCTASNVAPNVWVTAIRNQLSKLHEAAFKNTMKSAERYFSPEEVALIKTQSLELRDKKVY